MLSSLAHGENPIFNATLGKKGKRFKQTDRHIAILARLCTASGDTWSHLRKCVVEQFQANLTKSALIAGQAIKNQGEVEFEGTCSDSVIIAIGTLDKAPGSARVGLIELKWLELAIDPKVSAHKLFVCSDGDATKVSDQVAGSKELNKFCEATLAVNALCQEFLGLAECLFINSVERFRQLNPGKQWTSVELKYMMTFHQRLEKFAEQQGMTFDAKVNEALAALTAAIHPAFARGQKQCYGAIKVLVGLYAEGKELASVEDTKTRIPEPMPENKTLFDFIRAFLDVVAASSAISSNSGADACVAVLQGLAELLEQWPMKFEGSDSVVVSEWATWQDDLKELGFGRLEVWTRLQGAQSQISNYVRTTTESCNPNLRRACIEAEGKLIHLAPLLHRSESDFKQRMKKLALDLAKRQASIRSLCGTAQKFSAHCFGVALETDLATMADQCVAAIQYFVGVYTALVFYRYPETWEPKSDVAGKHKAALSSALMSWNENKDASVFETLCSHKVVAMMRQEMQIPARAVEPVELLVATMMAKWAAGVQAFGQVEEAAVDAEAVGVEASGHVEEAAVDADAVGVKASGHVEEAAVDAEAVGVRGAVSKGASGQVAGRMSAAKELPVRKRRQKKSTSPAPKAMNVKHQLMGRA